MESKRQQRKQQRQKNNELRQLAENISTPMNKITLAVASLTSLDSLSEELLDSRPRVSELLQGLSQTEIEQVHDAYWQIERVVSLVVKQGLTSHQAVREAQLEWLTTFDLSLLRYHEAEKTNKIILSRNWAPKLSEVDYTYIESIRTNVPPEKNNYEYLKQVGDSLAAERDGLAFGGMMFANGERKPISPKWVVLESGNIRPNGSACGSGWPSHRTLNLPEILDIGASDGRNNFLWNSNAPQGLVYPSNNLYSGSYQDQYFEMSRIAGDVIAIDLDKTGDKAAIIEHWGGQEWRVAIAELETGVRQYLCAPDHLHGDEIVQFSPAEDWILLSGYNNHLLIRTDTGSHFNLPVDNVWSAGWWPGYSADTLALILNTTDGIQLAVFDCQTALLSPLGPIKRPKSDLDEDRLFYSGLMVHPHNNVALLGAREGPSNSYQNEHGSRQRVAHLDLDSREISLLSDPFIGNDKRFERCHSDWRWVETPEPYCVSMNDRLMSTLKTEKCKEPDDAEYIGKKANSYLILAINTLRNQFNLGIFESVEQLRPEIYRSIDASLRYAYNQKLTHWLDLFSALIDKTSQHSENEFGSDPKLWGQSGASFVAFSRGLELSIAGRSDEIDWAIDRKA